MLWSGQFGGARDEWILYVVNGSLGDGFGLTYPLRKVVHMARPREWAAKLVVSVGPCRRISNHPFLPLKPR